MRRVLVASAASTIVARGAQVIGAPYTRAVRTPSLAIALDGVRSDVGDRPLAELQRAPVGCGSTVAVMTRRFRTQNIATNKLIKVACPATKGTRRATLSRRMNTVFFYTPLHTSCYSFARADL